MFKHYLLSDRKYVCIPIIFKITYIYIYVCIWFLEKSVDQFIDNQSTRIFLSTNSFNFSLFFLSETVFHFHFFSKYQITYTQHIFG